MGFDFGLRLVLGLYISLDLYFEFIDSNMYIAIFKFAIVLPRRLYVDASHF